jgi:hypothetical protein
VHRSFLNLTDINPYANFPKRTRSQSPTLLLLDKRITPPFAAWDVSSGMGQGVSQVGLVNSASNNQQCQFAVKQHGPLDDYIEFHPSGSSSMTLHGELDGGCGEQPQTNFYNSDGCQGYVFTVYGHTECVTNLHLLSALPFYNEHNGC